MFKYWFDAKIVEKDRLSFNNIFKHEVNRCALSINIFKIQRGDENLDIMKLLPIF